MPVENADHVLRISQPTTLQFLPWIDSTGLSPPSLPAGPHVWPQWKALARIRTRSCPQGHCTIEFSVIDELIVQSHHREAIVEPPDIDQDAVDVHLINCQVR